MRNLKIICPLLAVTMMISCAPPEEGIGIMGHGPKSDIEDLVGTEDLMEKDYFQIVKVVGYVGANVAVESSTRPLMEVYGQVNLEKRLIEYNLIKIIEANDSLIRISSDPEKRWCSKWLLAHELAHYLHGHLEEPNELKERDEELQSDRFAGFILGMLGAKLDESTFFPLSFFPEFSTDPDYPDRNQRVEFTELGWNDAKHLKNSYLKNQLSQ